MKVKIFYETFSDQMKFLLYEDRGGERHVVKPANIELVAIEQGMPCEATLSIPGHAARELMVSMAEELDSHGVKTDSDAKLSVV